VRGAGRTSIASLGSITWVLACTAPNPRFRPPAPELDASGAAGGGLDSSGPGGVAFDGRVGFDDRAPDFAVTPDAVSRPDAVSALPGALARWRLDEVTGRVAADDSGRNPGTLSGNATFVSPGFAPAGFANRGALALDGNSYVELGTAGLPRLEQPVTISVWLFVPATTLPLSNRKNVVALSNASAKQSLQLGIQNGYATVWRWASSPVFPSSVTLAAGWHHIAYTSDGITQSLFLEGSLHAAVPTRPPAAAVTAAFLGTYDSAEGAERFSGRIDDVRIYDRALTAEQIRALATGEP
jgi:large repetitive protein